MDIASLFPSLATPERIEIVARFDGADEPVLRREAPGSTPEAMLETRTRQHPMGRFAEPREVADVVVFLASKRASYVNGAIVSLDGGATPTVV